MPIQTSAVLASSVIWYVPDMTYNVFSGTLNLTQSIGTRGGDVMSKCWSGVKLATHHKIQWYTRLRVSRPLESSLPMFLQLNSPLIIVYYLVPLLY